MLRNFDWSCYSNSQTLVTLHVQQITHMEMIKGIAGHGYHDELVVPIIENSAREFELTDALAEAVIARFDHLLRSMVVSLVKSFVCSSCRCKYTTLALP